MKKDWLVFIAILTSSCSAQVTRELPPNPILTPPLQATGAAPGSSPSRPQFEPLGNAVQVIAYAREPNVAAGSSFIVSILFEPLQVRVSRKADGSIDQISTTPWTFAAVSEMQICTALDTICGLTGNWVPYEGTQEVKITGDWIGERSLWVRAQFRNENGTIVPSFSGFTQSLMQDSTQSNLQLTTRLDERTPLAALPMNIQTLVAATRAAFPVIGSVKIENGREMSGGKSGTTLQLHVQFTAASPFGNVNEMRIITYGTRKCAVELEMNQATWEPLVGDKIFPVVVPLDFASFDISAQYRDSKGNFSAIYCADIAIEGSP